MRLDLLGPVELVRDDGERTHRDGRAGRRPDRDGGLVEADADAASASDDGY